MSGKPSDSSFHWLWMTPLKLLQIPTGGGNGWEVGWIIYGILVPQAFWIMTVAKKLIVQKAPLFIWVTAGTFEHSSGEKALTQAQEMQHCLCGRLSSDLLLIQ